MDKCTRELLGFQDESLIFEKDRWFSRGVDKKNRKFNRIDGLYAKVPTHCESCGVLFQSSADYYKHGTIANKRVIQVPEYNGEKSMLYLKIERYKCRHCEETVSAKLPETFVRSGKKTSRKLELQIILDFHRNMNMKDIASIRNVEYGVVPRLLSELKGRNPENFRSLPEILCIDELKATKDCRGNMAFIAVDGISHKVQTILDDRRMDQLIRHFLQYPRKERLKVKRLVMDMNAAYHLLVRVVFPNAKIVTDRFHVVQQITRAFNSLRVQIMKQFRTKDKEEGKKYRHLKKFWKLLLKDSEKLSRKKRYNYTFKRYLSSLDIVSSLKEYAPVLEEAYELSQILRYHFKNKQADFFFDIIRALDTTILPELFVKKMKFLLSKEESIRKGLEEPYSNGCVEGLNNKLKVIKRLAYGFRRFENFRTRSYIQCGLLTGICKVV